MNSNLASLALSFLSRPCPSALPSTPECTSKFGLYWCDVSTSMGTLLDDCLPFQARSPTPCWAQKQDSRRPREESGPCKTLSIRPHLTYTNDPSKQQAFPHSRLSYASSKAANCRLICKVLTAPLLLTSFFHRTKLAIRGDKSLQIILRYAE